MTTAVDPQAEWTLRALGGTFAGEVVVDVGANVGRLSQFFWDHGDARTRVISVEPWPANVESLRARCDAAGDERWRVEACACSDRDGTTWIEGEHTSEHGWNAAVRPAAGAGRIEVPCRTLCSLAEDATIVKLDVEGHEYPILDQALPTLARVHAWVLELHLVPGRPLERTLARLAAAGHRLHAAGQRRDDPSGAWHAVPIAPSLTWDAIPVAKKRADGSVFKMLHVLARRSVA